MTEFDFLDAIDIVSNLPSDFQTNLDSKKWTDRRDTLQALLDLLEKSPRLSPKTQYKELVIQLTRVLDKDSNINVCALAAQCIRGIAAGLRDNFGMYASSVVPVILERFKEKKPVLKNPLVECIDAVFASANMDQLQEVICTAMQKPNPSIKKETDLALCRIFKYFNATTMPKKTLKGISPFLVKHTSDPDPEVRDAACETLGSAMRAMGEGPMVPLLAGVAEDRISKIKEYCQKILEEVGLEGLGHKMDSETEIKQNTSSVDDAISQPPSVKEVDPFELLDPVDVLPKLSKEFQVNMESKKWTDRRDALQELLDLLVKFPKLDPKAHYGELISQLKTCLEKDSNINVCALSAQCIRGIAAGLRKDFAYASLVVPVILERFKEKKTTLKNPLVECIDTIFFSTHLDRMQEDLSIAMEKTNPNIKKETDLFLSRACKNFNTATMPRKTLKAVIPLLIKHAHDSDPEVREASFDALGSIMRAIGEKTIIPLLGEISSDKTKMAKITEYYKKYLEEVGPNGLGKCLYSVEETLPENAAVVGLDKSKQKKVPPKSTVIERKSEPKKTERIMQTGPPSRPITQPRPPTAQPRLSTAQSRPTTQSRPTAPQRPMAPQRSTAPQRPTASQSQPLKQVSRLTSSTKPMSAVPTVTRANNVKPSAVQSARTEKTELSSVHNLDRPLSARPASRPISSNSRIPLPSSVKKPNESENSLLSGIPRPSGIPRCK